MQGEKLLYRIEWSFLGEHQNPPGPGARGVGGPLTLQQAQDIFESLAPKRGGFIWPGNSTLNFPFTGKE